MFLRQPSPTGYEIKFRIFGISVEVHPFFWIAGLIFVGQSAVTFSVGNKLVNLIAAMLIFFLSILIHELGHSIAMAFYGIHSRIVLYAFGGMAIPIGRLPGKFHNSMWDQIVISAAGPFAQFCVLGLIILSGLLGGVDFGLSRSFPFLTFEYLGPPVIAGLSVWLALWVAIFVNFIWPLFNLLPILPLDGGRICQGLCQIYQGNHRGVVASLWVSVVTGVFLVILLFQAQEIYMALFIGYLTYQSLQELQSGRGM